MPSAALLQRPPGGYTGVMTRERKTSLKAKAKAARRSWTVWFAAAVPVLATVAAVAQEQLPGLKEQLGPWTYALASVGVSGVVAWLRVRSVSVATGGATGGGGGAGGEGGGND